MVVDHKSKKTILHVACELGAVEIVQELLRYDGLNIYAESREGRNALYYACDGNHWEIVRLLLSGEYSLELKEKGEQKVAHVNGRKEKGSLAN